MDIFKTIKNIGDFYQRLVLIKLIKLIKLRIKFNNLALICYISLIQLYLYSKELVSFYLFESKYI